MWLYAVDLPRIKKCQVLIDGKSLVVVLPEKERLVWTFHERSAGHYDLKCSPGEITLHRFQDDNYLEGSVKYGDTLRMGMLRIDLKHPPEIIEVGNNILLKDGRKWAKQKVTAFKNGRISTKEFNDVTLDDLGETWQLP